jgi:hypothetical protein
MSLNQPDQTLSIPVGSPLGESQAHNLATGRIKPGEQRNADPKLQKAQAEYEAWLAKKEERESGVGHPHDYGTRDWAAKGRVPARPAALDKMNSESSTMAQQAPALPVPVPAPPRQMVQAQAPVVSSMPPIPPVPILVHAVDDEQPARDPIMVTPVYPPPPGMPPVPHNPAFLSEPRIAGSGSLSNRSSMNDMQAAYAQDQGPPFMPEFAGGPMLPSDMDPMAAWGPYQHPYPYDPSFGYEMDPAMYQQYWNPSNSWYGPQYDMNGGQFPAQGVDDGAQQAA